MSDFNWSFPYPSQRMPILAENVVATSQPLAAQAGLEMLRKGGNAVDAAIATAIALTVVEPTANGIGSDAFALVWKDGELHGLNASGKAPEAIDASRLRSLDRVPLNGWDPVTVPGAVSAWVTASRRFGKLNFEALFEPAIRYARDGFPVSPQTAGGWRAVPSRWPKDLSIQQAFAPGGSTPAAGEQWRFEDQARTLGQIAASNGEAFYTGELARKIVADAKMNGGAMTMDDLAAHTPQWVEPIEIDYHGYTLHEIPPNGQGLTALLMLGIIRHHPIRDLAPDCPDSLHLQIEAMKLAFADAHRYIADPAFMDVSIDALLDPAYLRSRAEMIDPAKATDFKHGSPKPSGTVLLCAADADGCMVSFIQSNYTGFGSGIVVPGTGISLQNRGGCFETAAGHPNQVAGGKRPYHTIIPGFVTRKRENGQHEPVMAFGVMGGYMQPQGHAQVMIRMADHQQNPQAALDAPRWQIKEGLEVDIEPGFPDDVYEVLKGRGHDLRRARRQSVSFGGGQAIYRLESGAGYLGASDLRRDGQAVGF